MHGAANVAGAWDISGIFGSFTAKHQRNVTQIFSLPTASEDSSWSLSQSNGNVQLPLGRYYSSHTEPLKLLQPKHFMKAHLHWSLWCAPLLETVDRTRRNGLADPMCHTRYAKPTMDKATGGHQGSEVTPGPNFGSVQSSAHVHLLLSRRASRRSENAERADSSVTRVVRGVL